MATDSEQSLSVDIAHIEITPRTAAEVCAEGPIDFISDSSHADYEMPKTHNQHVSFDPATKREDGEGLLSVNRLRNKENGDDDDDDDDDRDDESSVYSTVDTLDGILEEIRESGNIPRMVQMACERLQEYMKGTTGIDDEVKVWAEVLRALLGTQDIEAILLATNLLKGQYGIPWAVERQEVLKMLSALVKNPPNLEVEPEEQELLAAYGNLIAALANFIDDAVVSRLLWDGLFSQKSLFYVFGLAAVTHVDYIAKMGNNERVKFLHRLQALLADSREEIFRSGYSGTFDRSLGDIIPLCLADITDGEGFSEEVNRIINTCITLNLYCLDSGGLTAHGTCLLKILESTSEAENQEYLCRVAHANLNSLYDWAVQDTPKACTRIPEACHCKLGAFADASRNILARIATMKLFEGKLSMKRLVEIYERHRTPGALKAIADVYPHGKEEARKIFPTLMEILTKSEENSPGQDDLYTLLIRISRHDDRQYHTMHVEQLETRMERYSTEVIHILDIFVHLANLNTPLMMGRGETFHKTALGSPKPVDSILKVNRSFLWVGCFSEEEAERVVGLMERAYKNNLEIMSEPKVINSICAAWKGIAEVHQEPVRKRETLLRAWTQHDETAEAATRVLMLVATSKTCCVVQ